MIVFRETSNIQVSTLQIATQNSAGSAVLLDTSGKIATCAHVVEGQSEGRLFILGNKEVEYKYDTLAIGKKVANDVAILQSRPNVYKDLASVVDDFHVPSFIVRRSKLDVGMVLAVCGYPAIESISDTKGNPPTIAIGVLSRMRYPSGPVMVSAPVYPGNSGGPCFTTDGKVVGVVAAQHPLGSIALRDYRGEMSFSVPSTFAEIFPMSTVRFLAEKRGINIRWSK